MKTLREKIEELTRFSPGVTYMDADSDGAWIGYHDVLRIVAEHEQAQAPVLDLTPGGPMKGGDARDPKDRARARHSETSARTRTLHASPDGIAVAPPPVGQAGGDEVTEARERLADIKRQMKALGDDRGWQWDSLDGLREEAQADYDHAVGMQLLEVEQMACDADEGAK